MLGFYDWYFNLPKWVPPIVSSVATVSASDKQTNQMPVRSAPLSPGPAMEAAQALYPDARISRIALPARPFMPYEIRVRQPGEIRRGDGATRITIDAYSGKMLQVRDPLRAPGGDMFLNRLFPLHSGDAFGNAGRGPIRQHAKTYESHTQPQGTPLDLNLSTTKIAPTMLS